MTDWRGEVGLAAHAGARPPNKAMKLTKLSAALWYGRDRMHVGQVPPRARAASMDAGTASQLIASVRRTHGQG